MSDVLERPKVVERVREPERWAGRWRALKRMVYECTICGRLTRIDPGDCATGCHPEVYPSEAAALEAVDAWGGVPGVAEPAGAVRLP